jgi:hypothetical protein
VDLTDVTTIYVLFFSFGLTEGAAVSSFGPTEFNAHTF